MTDDFKLILFPREASILGESSATLDVMAGVTELLRASDRLSKVAAASDLDEDKRLQIVQTVREIVVSASSLYLIVMNEGEHSQAARAHIEGIIEDLNRLR